MMQIIGAIVLVAIATVGLMLWHGDLKLPSEKDVQIAIDKVGHSDWLDGILKEAGEGIDVAREKLDPETVKAEVKTWALKDGIPLPKGWSLEERTNDVVKITVLVPPNPKGENDYIAYKIKASLVDNLPGTPICTEPEANSDRVTCAVGNNIETIRVFTLLTYKQN